MEVRAAYCEEDFEFDQLERLAKKGMKEANIKLMRSSAAASLTALEGAEAANAAAADDGNIQQVEERGSGQL